jgi:hypothetical protein
MEVLKEMLVEKKTQFFLALGAYMKERVVLKFSPGAHMAGWLELFKHIFAW